MWDEKSSNDASKQYDKFDAPKSILKWCSWISRVPYPNHQERHEEEKEGYNEADSVDSKISYEILTFDL